MFMETEQIANELIENSPEPSLDAFPESQQEKVKETFKEAVTSITDKFGNAFDPDIHFTNNDGTPRINKANQIRIRTGKGKAAASKSGVKVNPQKKSSIGGLPKKEGNETIAQPVNDEAVSEEELKRAAKDTVNTVEMAGVIVFQSDGLMTNSERLSMETAFERLFEKRGIISPPPEFSVLACCGAYAFHRLNLPDSQEKQKKGDEVKLTRLQKLQLKFGGYMAKKKMQKENKLKKHESPVQTKEDFNDGA